MFTKLQITFKISKFLYINDEEIVRTMYKSIHRNEDKKLHDNNITQFLCVMNGGKLVQNCKNHALWGTHGITDGVVTYEITSTHHQMQYPYNLSSSSYDLLYKSEPRLSSIYASNNCGITFFPEKGDEVILGFIENNPKEPIIIGNVLTFSFLPASTIVNSSAISSFFLVSFAFLAVKNKKNA